MSRVVAAASGWARWRLNLAISNDPSDRVIDGPALEFWNG